jgi:tetratricopeptide (TPR) repeat protein
MRKAILFAGKIIFVSIVLSLLAMAQSPAQENPPASTVTADLPLDPARRAELEAAIRERNYTRAETILVEEINRETARDQKSPRAAKLLVAAGGLFFLDGQFLNSAISYKKAEAIAPLDERSRFTLAMAYIKLDRRDWARAEMEKLSASQPKNALYLYWLARLDYDAQNYNAAIEKLRRVVELDPQMMRAWDNLGLCYDYLGQFDEAVRNYRRAVELNRRQPQPSPWPHLNLAVTLISMNNLTEAESQLRLALRYDSKLPQSHYQLGLALEKQNRSAEAIASLLQAATLDPTFPEPHYTLGRLYQKQGETAKAKESFAQFQRLKEAKRQAK